MGKLMTRVRIRSAILGAALVSLLAVEVVVDDSIPDRSEWFLLGEGETSSVSYFMLKKTVSAQTENVQIGRIHSILPSVLGKSLLAAVICRRYIT